LSNIDEMFGTGGFAAGLRLAGLGFVVWSVFAASPEPGAGERGVVVAVLLAAAAASWLAWTIVVSRARALPRRGGVPPYLYVMALAGGLLCGASPDSAASAFVFVCVVAAVLRAGIVRALPVVALGTLALVTADVAYDHGGLATAAYGLGFAGAALVGSSARQSSLRAEQAEVLLAQTQRAHEEELRAARLEESTRIARDIHDLLAHTLAGLMIQLEATATVVKQGSDDATVLARVERAYELARQGLVEARRAVGALRGDRDTPVADALAALVVGHRAVTSGAVDLTVVGDVRRLEGPCGDAALRVVQEALTNVAKHAAGASVTVTVDAGLDGEDDIVARVHNSGRSSAASPEEPGRGPASRAADELVATGGTYGLRGMSERAALLGGTVDAGPAADGDGWLVELRVPAAGTSRTARTAPDRVRPNQ
jgi:signal transduction histidine kinase